MATGDSQLHAVSALISTDVYKKYINKNADEAKQYKVAKICVLIFGVISIIFALLKPAMLSDILTLSNAGVGALVPTVIGGLYWKRSTKAAAISSIIAGEAIMVLFTFILKVSPLGFGAGLWSMFVSLVVFVTVSLLTKPSEHVSEVVDSINKYFAVVK